MIEVRGEWPDAPGGEYDERLADLLAQPTGHAPPPKWWPGQAERVGTLSGAETCRRCRGENVRWAAPSPLWNRVMRGNDINGDPKWGDLVCIRCFIVLAEEAGVRPSRWRVSADPEPDGLIYETPSGRVWDAERWLWVDAP